MLLNEKLTTVRITDEWWVKLELGFAYLPAILKSNKNTIKYLLDYLNYNK